VKNEEWKIEDQQFSAHLRWISARCNQQISPHAGHFLR